MTKYMSTYDRVEKLLEAKHEILTVKLAELKKDTEEIKEHAKETNGNVARNVEKIHQLDINASQNTAFRKRSWSLVIPVVALFVWEIISKIFM